MSSHKNLNVPFNVPIPGGMYPGKMVVVSGTIPSMSPRFAVNLLTRSGDIALHVCPRFKENQVVRNNVHNMNWGPEERHGSMPVYAGQSFEVMILCEAYDFKIAFNGRHFTEFKHRLPYNTITSLAVDGEVVVYEVNFKEPSSSSGHINNNSASSLPYGFQPAQPAKSGGLYPTVPLADTTPGGYSNSHGTGHPQNPSVHPSQPSYPSIPHRGPYPQVPSSHPGGHGQTHEKPGSSFLDLAGALGPTLLAGAINRKLGTHGTHGTHGGSSFMDEAGRALIGSLIGGSGVTGTNRSLGGTHPTSSLDSGFLNQAGSALAGILSGAGGGSLGGRTPHTGVPGFSTPRTQHGSILDQAGTALADIIGGGGLGGRTHRGVLPTGPTTHTQHGSILDQAGSALADILAGGGSSGRSQRSTLSSTPTSRGNAGYMDEVGRGRSDSFGDSGLRGTGHHKHKKLGGILGGTLGTAIAGAALTGHINPIKAAKKQRKAQKKALKYGLPIAGVGLGAYALHKGFKGFRRSSSSSSSSSCSSSD